MKGNKGARDSRFQGLSFTQDHEVLGDATVEPGPVDCNLLVALLDQGPDPDADVGGNDVSQAEAGNAFELVDIQLGEGTRKKISQHCFIPIHEYNTWIV